MTSLMTRSVVLFLCWEIVAQCSAKDFNISYYDFSAVFNGRFSNRDDKEAGQDRMTFLFKPALAPGLHKEPVLYYEETINGKLHRMLVIVKNESSTDRILYVDYYNFTDPRQHEAGTFNTDDLANYQREDFHSVPNCQGTLEKISEDTLIGEVNEPRHTVHRHHPLYSFTASCDDFHLIVPRSVDETTTRAPYHLEHRGNRFPLINAPEVYVSPCQEDVQ